MKTITVFLMAALLSTSASIAGPGGQWKHGCDGPEGRGFQRGERPEHGESGIRHLLRNADEIGLNEKQVTRLYELATNFPLAQVDREAAVKKAQIGLKVLTHNDNSSEKEVNAAIDKLAGLRADIHKARYARRKAIHDLLTDAQRDKIKQLRKEHRSRADVRDEHSRRRSGNEEHGW